MLKCVAVHHDYAEESGEQASQRCKWREYAYDSNQQDIRKPSVPFCLHGQKDMKKSHHKHEKACLLYERNDDSVVRPPAYIHKINHRLCSIHRINDRMNQCIGKRDG